MCLGIQIYFFEKNNYFSFNVFSCFFMLEILESAPSLTVTG